MSQFNDLGGLFSGGGFPGEYISDTSHFQVKPGVLKELINN